MAFGRTGLTPRPKATVSTPPSCSSTLMRWRSTGPSRSPRPSSAIDPNAHDADLGPTKPTARRSCLKLSSTKPASAQPSGLTKRPWADAIIYELHVRGFTKQNSAVFQKRSRGTFAGLAHPAAIGHLKWLGVTAVEILPCAAWIDEWHLKTAGPDEFLGL